MIVELSYDEHLGLASALRRAKEDMEYEARGWEEREFGFSGRQREACRSRIEFCRERAGQYQALLDKLYRAAREA